jgi:hypothetical protein
MAAAVIFVIALMPISDLFTQGNMTLGKSKYLFLASTTAIGELERFRTGRFSDMTAFAHDWKKLSECDQDIINLEFEGYPENIMERFEKKVVITSLNNDLKKAIISIRWSESIHGHVKHRQLNYPMLFNRRWRFE